MIEAKNLTKKFDSIVAVDHIDARIKDGCVFGLIGTNGAGKSTFLRMACGVLKPDEGTIQIDGEDVYENTKVKGRFFYISDDQFFFGNGTPQEMMTKGMKKQLSVILGLCANTEYLFCDETFDGLDPVMRQAVKSLFANDMAERNLTPIIASHNLRELEDICDHVGILHKGGILLSKDLDDMKLNLHKIQCVLRPGREAGEIPGLEILKTERRGSLSTITVRGTREEVEAAMRSCEPVFFEAIPLSLEEIFISETEVAGYDVKKLIF